MRLARLLAPLLGAALMAAAAPALAHHSFAMFDMTRTVTLDGVVKDFQWTNPHVILWIETTPAHGAPEVWSAELTSPGNLTRGGWTKRSLKPGDKVAVELHPLRDGGKGGGFEKAVIKDTGHVLSADLRTAVDPSAR